MINIQKIHSESEINKILIENSIALQGIMTNLSTKFDSLTKQISKLLDLFETSAKSVAEKNLGTSKDEESKEVIKKLDDLLEQNKIIARGLTLLHESTTPVIPRQNTIQQPFQERQEQKPSLDMEKYQKSIASKSDFNEN